MTTRAIPLTLSLALLPACEPGGETTTGTESETGSNTESDSETTGGEAAVCERYVSCYEAAIPDNDGQTAEHYGEGGTCWQEQAASACEDECTTGLLQYHKAFPDLGECALPETDVTFEIGEAEFSADPYAAPTYRPLEDGDTLHMVLGGQGLFMLPVGMRGQNFETAPEPWEFEHPKMPTINLTLNVEGFNNGVGGHFSRLANYPVHFVDVGGALEHMYVTIIVPEELYDTCSMLDGKPATLEIELWTFENPPVTRALDLVIAAAPECP